jgi:apolipoprotein N-acyltransferase
VTIYLIFLGLLCYYLALPPAELAPLVLITPVCWAAAVQRPDPVRYRRIFFAAMLFWIASIWWIACPHPLIIAGLILLAAALSCILLLFFISARTAVHCFRVPLIIAVPVCWIGCEYIRCHLFGGFSFCAPEHAFYRFPCFLVPWAAVGGSMLVGGIIMLTGSCFVRFFSAKRRSEKLAAAVLILFFPLVSYDWYQDSFRKDSLHRTDAEIAALQGSSQIYLTDSPEQAEKNFLQFVELTYQLVNDRKKNGQPMPALIVIPETVCPIPVLSFAEGVQPGDAGLTEEQARQWETELRRFVDSIGLPVIFGVSTYIIDQEFAADLKNALRNGETGEDIMPQRRNSALLITPGGGHTPSPVYRYDKNELVMFGEYMPFADLLPKNFFIRTLCQESGHGTEPLAVPIRSGQDAPLHASINICFESSVSHFIRRQILTLRKRGDDPRVLINLSNDGWFRFLPQIEQHLATHVFRAVENRMWYVTSTNSGLSAIISPYGKIIKIGKRGAAEAVCGVVGADLTKPAEVTVYQRIGDGYALLCAVLVLVSVLTVLAGRSYFGAFPKDCPCGSTRRS